jgi:hypothetical protein
MERLVKEIRVDLNKGWLREGPRKWEGRRS